MKRVVSLLLAFLFFLPFAACTEKNTGGKTDMSETTPDATTTIPAETTTEAAEPGYDAAFVMYLRSALPWTPFEDGENVTFTLSGDDTLTLEDDGKTVEITAWKSGEAVVSAACGDQTKTAHVKTQSPKDGAFDIVIQAGQSNATGWGDGPWSADPYVPNDRVWYMEVDGSVVLAEEQLNTDRKVNCNNFSLTFARQYINDGRLGEGRQVLVLRAALGGTGFGDNRWHVGDDLYNRMIRMIKRALGWNEENRIVALLWHQGETESNVAAYGTTYEMHYNNLSAVVSGVRKELDFPELPFICADFCYDWRQYNTEICDLLVAAMKDVCAEGYGAFVETSDLTSNAQAIGAGEADSIHFSRQAIDILGVRYYDAFVGIVENR